VAALHTVQSAERIRGEGPQPGDGWVEREADDTPPRADSEESSQDEEVARVWRVLRRLGVAAADADDAVQQVFLVATERQASIRPGKRRAFVYGVALRVAQAFRRRPPRQMDELDEEMLAEADAPEMEELLDQRRNRQQLDRLLEQMPFDLRAVFVLFEIEDLSTPEIAQALDLPKGTVASRLRRAREDFVARARELRDRPESNGGKP
jgi:RNA polymerase sigma-70 factor, ECF subfamily